MTRASILIWRTIGWQHGVYGQTDSGQIVPGIPDCRAIRHFWRRFSGCLAWGKFELVFVAQILIDLGTCLLIADLARRMIAGRWAGRVAFLLAALCPFLANYATAILTETLEVFFTALALDCAAAALIEGVKSGFKRRATGVGLCGQRLAGLLRPVFCCDRTAEFARRGRAVCGCRGP